MSIIENLETLLAKGQDNALLRYSLGNEYLKQGKPERALSHLQRAVDQNPTHSAAWKLFGKTLIELGRLDQAIEIFGKGIATAERQGDIQAAKEMKVFRKRAEKSRPKKD